METFLAILLLAIFVLFLAGLQHVGRETAIIGMALAGLSLFGGIPIVIIGWAFDQWLFFDGIKGLIKASFYIFVGTFIVSAVLRGFEIIFSDSNKPDSE